MLLLYFLRYFVLLTCNGIQDRRLQHSCSGKVRGLHVRTRLLISKWLFDKPITQSLAAVILKFTIFQFEAKCLKTPQSQSYFCIILYHMYIFFCNHNSNLISNFTHSNKHGKHEKAPQFFGKPLMYLIWNDRLNGNVVMTCVHGQTTRYCIVFKGIMNLIHIDAMH